MLKNVANVSNTANNLSRQEILKWLNALLVCEIPKIDELCTGAAYCQLFHILRPDGINLRRVKFVTNLTTDYTQNFKLLQNAFTKYQVTKEVPIQLLIKGHFQDNLDFIQWFKKFYDMNHNPNQPYDALQARAYEPIALCASMQKELLKNNIRMSLTSLNSSITQLRNADANDLTTQPALRRATTLGVDSMNFGKYARKSALIQSEEQNIVDACQKKVLNILHRFIQKTVSNIDVIDGAQNILLPEDLLSGITTEERKAVEEFMAKSQDKKIYSSVGQLHFDLSLVKCIDQVVLVPHKSSEQVDDFKDTLDNGSGETSENTNSAQFDSDDTSARVELDLSIPEMEPNARVEEWLNGLQNVVAPSMGNISEINQLNPSCNNQDDMDIKYTKSCIFVNANIKAAGEESMVAIAAKKVSIDSHSNQNTTTIISQQIIADVEETNQDQEILQQHTKEVESSITNNEAEELKEVVISPTNTKFSLESSEDNISNDKEVRFKATLSEIELETNYECVDNTTENFEIATPRMNNLSICKVAPQYKYRAQIIERIEIEASCMTNPKQASLGTAINFKGVSNNYNKSGDGDVLTTQRAIKPIQQKTPIFEEAKAINLEATSPDNVNLDETKQSKIESLETKSPNFKDFTQNSNDCQDNKPKTSIESSETYKWKTSLDERKIANTSNKEVGLLEESGKWPNKSLNFNCLPSQGSNDNLTETDLYNFSKLDGALQELDTDSSLLLYQTAKCYPDSFNFKPNYHSSTYLSDTSSPMFQEYQKKDENQNLLSDALLTLNGTEVKESSKDLPRELQNHNPIWSKTLLGEELKLVLYTKEGSEKNTRLINYLKNCLEKLCSSTDQLNAEKLVEDTEKRLKNSPLPKPAENRQQMSECLDSSLDKEDFSSDSSGLSINSDELKEGEDLPANVRTKKGTNLVKLFPLTGEHLQKGKKKHFLRCMLGRKI